MITETLQAAERDIIQYLEENTFRGRWRNVSLEFRLKNLLGVIQAVRLHIELFTPEKDRRQPRG